MSQSPSCLVLIDGNAIMHRAYHALPPLTTAQGQMVNAVYGFSTMLFKIIDDVKPTHLAVAFDTAAPTFRHEKYLNYQAHRPHMDEDLNSQFAPVTEVLDQLEIPVFRLAGFEADDIIGTLAKKATHQKTGIKKVIIVTGDKDLFQLINQRINLYVPQKGVSDYALFNSAKVKATLGISPNQVVDYKALTGDPSDNYPGVPGIGPKTTVDLLAKYKHLANIYRHLHEVPPPVSQKLQAGKELAQTSYELATIITTAPIKLDLQATRFHPLDKNKAISIFRQLGFKSLVSRLSGVGEKPKTVKKASKNRQLNLL